MRFLLRNNIITSMILEFALDGLRVRKLPLNPGVAFVQGLLNVGEVVHGTVL